MIVPVRPAIRPNRPIRPIREDERIELARLAGSHWGSSTIVSRGVCHDVARLPCLLAVDGDRWLGVAAYRQDGDQCELILLEAFQRGSAWGPPCSKPPWM